MPENSKEQFFAQEMPKIEGRFEERKQEYAETQEIKHEREVLHEVLTEHAHELAASPYVQAPAAAQAKAPNSRFIANRVHEPETHGLSYFLHCRAGALRFQESIVSGTLHDIPTGIDAR